MNATKVEGGARSVQLAVMRRPSLTIEQATLEVRRRLAAVARQASARNAMAVGIPRALAAAT